jgi:hypothetical protein
MFDEAQSRYLESFHFSLYHFAPFIFSFFGSQLAAIVQNIPLPFSATF